MNAPTVRLAIANGVAKRNINDAPTVRLALANGQAERNGTSGFERATQVEDVNAPGLLVSFVYLEPFLKNRARYQFRDWVMDSGAFSAHHLGRPIVLADYIATCQQLLASDPTLVEVYALDVIRDHVASQRNCEAMWAAGLRAIPCYHHGEPESVLREMAQTYPKIALGGAVGLKKAYKLRWAEQCFARVWPKPIHGFGFGSKDHLLALPWHSVDATNWESGPCRWGNWERYGQMSVKGSYQNLRGEVEHFLDMERLARVKWKREMEQIAALPEGGLA